MKKLIITALASTALFVTSAHAQAPAKAATCVGCHGADGNSMVPKSKQYFLNTTFFKRCLKLILPVISKIMLS
jgi:hypothetical protein